MSLVTPVQRDVEEYEEKVFLGLSARKLACAGAGIALVAMEMLVAYFAFSASFENLVVQILVIATGLTCFAVAVVKPLGMPLEKAAPLWLQQHFGTTVLYYKSHAALAAEGRDESANNEDGKKDDRKAEERREKEYRKLTKRRGARNPEYLLPRYCGQLGAAKAVEERATGGDEGARS